MPRHIDRQDIIAVMGEIAGLQGPDRMIHSGAMQKHDGWLVGHKGSPAGGGKNHRVVYD